MGKNPTKVLLLGVCAVGLAVEVAAIPVLAQYDFFEYLKWYFGLSVSDVFEYSDARERASYVLQSLFHLALVAGLVVGIISRTSPNRTGPAGAHLGHPGISAWGTPTGQGTPQPPAL